MCKISIIMPVYNKEKYIKKAIESILAQTFQDWELIIVDDGSSDSSYSISKTYGDKRILVHHQENGGVSRARNTGLDLARGEYITFIDADDYIADDYLEKMYRPKADMIISGLTKVNHEGKTVLKVLPVLNGNKSLKEVASGFYQEQVKTGIYGYVAGKLIRRNVIEKNCIRFDETIRLAEDYDFYLKIYGEIKGIDFLQYSGYYYLQETENSAIALHDEKVDFFVQVQLQKKTRQFLLKMDCYGEEEEQIYLQRMTGYVYTILLLNKQVSYREYCTVFSRLKEEVPEVTEDVSGIEKWCITQYKKNRQLLIYLFLKLRVMMGK